MWLIVNSDRQGCAGAAPARARVLQRAPPRMKRLLLTVVLIGGCNNKSDPDKPPNLVDLTAKGIGKLSDLAADERRRNDEATRQLDGIVAGVDKLIDDHDYEKAYLEASKIRWPFHSSHYDEQRTKDYDAIRSARITIIEKHLPAATR